jgi:hypothetical protein
MADEGQHLQQMILDHVAQRARPVVVARPALQPQRLEPGDVDRLM